MSQKVGVIVFVAVFTLSGWDWLQSGQPASFIELSGLITVFLLGSQAKQTTQQ